VHAIIKKCELGEMKSMNAALNCNHSALIDEKCIINAEEWRKNVCSNPHSSAFELHAKSEISLVPMLKLKLARNSKVGKNETIFSPRFV